MRKGPLIVYGNESTGVKQAARNLPGVDTCHVNRLNVLQLAPGGHLGRFVIFTKDGFKALNGIFGTPSNVSQEKKGYRLNRSVMSCADICRIINSDQVQTKLREVRTSIRSHDKNKKNPLTNKAIMQKLNPFAKKKAEILAKLEKELGSDQFEVVAISVDRKGAEASAAFLKETGVDNLKLFIEPSTKIVNDLKSAGLPATLLIDRQGRELGRILGPADWASPEAVALVKAALAQN